MDSKEQAKVLDGITSFIASKPGWFDQQMQSCMEKAKGQELAGWLELAHAAASPEMVFEALRQFVDLVETKSLDWTTEDTDCFENIVFAGARAVVQEGARIQKGLSRRFSMT